MATFTITRGTNSVTINDYVDEQPGQYKLFVDSLNDILVIKAEDGSYQGEVHTLVDTVTVNGEAFAGTAAELKTLLLSDVFTVAGSGSTTPVILQSPDGSLWLVTVNNSGVLQTQLVESGTPSELFLYSPDGTRWEVTVNNEGALTTTAV